jgi:REP element-mobilizing transposase RayT
MGRRHRREAAGAIYHVTCRGNSGQPILSERGDALAFLEIFERICARFGWECFAYCLMPNHYHLVVETLAPNLAVGMHALNFRYSRRFLWRHGRSGHVFEGPYDAVPIEDDRYLLVCCRYVALNPVKGGLVADAGDWPWSSFAATAGRRPAEPWLATGRLLATLGAGREAEARREWVRYVHARTDG